MAQNIITQAASLNLGQMNSTGELLQQIAWLNHMNKKDEASEAMLKQITTLRVVSDVWSRVSKQDEIDRQQAIVIGRIADFVNKNKNNKAEITKYVAQQIQEYAQFIDDL